MIHQNLPNHKTLYNQNNIKAELFITEVKSVRHKVTLSFTFSFQRKFTDEQKIFQSTQYILKQKQKPFKKKIYMYTYVDSVIVLFLN